MPIGERDACLLDIREKLFGPVFLNTTNCPECGQKMEWEMPVESIKLQPAGTGREQKPIELGYNGYQVSFRLPNSTDILEIMALGDSGFHEEALLKKCIDVSTLPTPLSEDLPEDLKSAILQKMEEHDPQADITMKIQCPECGHNWDVTFDIMQYLWAEIDDWAVRLVQDIYLLASNFGWPEKDILDMSRFRRNLYINMIYA